MSSPFDCNQIAALEWGKSSWCCFGFTSPQSCTVLLEASAVTSVGVPPRLHLLRCFLGQVRQLHRILTRESLGKSCHDVTSSRPGTRWVRSSCLCSRAPLHNRSRSSVKLQDTWVTTHFFAFFLSFKSSSWGNGNSLSEAPRACGREPLLLRVHQCVSPILTFNQCSNINLSPGTTFINRFILSEGPEGKCKIHRSSQADWSKKQNKKNNPKT